MATPFDLANAPSTQEEVPTPLRRFSSYIDQFFQPVGQALAKPLGAAAGAITHYVAPSQEQAVRQGVEEGVMGLPRTVAEAAPFMMRNAPGPLKALGLADVALRSYAGTPPDATVPQQLGATALNTAGFLAAPKIGGGLGQTIAKSLAPGSMIASRVGSAAGTVGAFKALGAGSAALTGQEYDPFSVRTLAGDVANVLPWEVGGFYHDYMTQRRNQDKAAELTKQREYNPAPKEMAYFQRDENGNPIDAEGNPMERKGDWNDRRHNRKPKDPTGDEHLAWLENRLAPSEWQDMVSKGVLDKFGGSERFSHDELRKWMMSSITEPSLPGMEMSGAKAMDVDPESGESTQLPTKFNYEKPALLKRPTEYRRPDDITLRPRSFEGRSFNHLINFWADAIRTPWQGEAANYTTLEARVSLPKRMIIWSRVDELRAKYGDQIPTSEIKAIQDRIQNTNLEDLPPTDLRVLWDKVKKGHERRLAEISQGVGSGSEKALSALETENSLFHEMRARLFDYGIKQRDNVVDAPLQDIIKRKEELESDLTQLYSKGRLSFIERQREQVLSKKLLSVDDILRATPEGATKLANQLNNLAAIRQQALGKQMSKERVAEPLTGDYKKDFVIVAQDAAATGGDISRLSPDRIAFLEKLSDVENTKWNALVKHYGTQADWSSLRRVKLTPHTPLQKPVKVRLASNYELPFDKITMSRTGPTEGLFYGSKVTAGKAKQFQTKEFPTSGEDVLTAKYDVLENTGDAGNAPLSELLNGRILSLDKDLYDMVQGKEGMEQPLDTDLLAAIQLKRDGYNLVHLVDPESDANIVTVDLRHTTEKQLTTELQKRLKEAESLGKKDGPRKMERFADELFSVRKEGYGMKEMQLSKTIKDALNELEMRLEGMDPVEKAQRLRDAAERQMAIPDRKPGEDLYHYLVRTSGIDPRINDLNDKFTLLESWRDLFRKSMELNGVPIEEIARLEPWAMRFAATIGKDLGETRVLPAMPIERAEGKVNQGFFTGSRGDLPNAFLGLVPQTGGFKGVYQILHNFAHEIWHNHVDQARGSTYDPNGLGKSTRKLEIVNNLLQVAREMPLLDRQATMRALAGQISSAVPTDFISRRMAAYSNEEEFLGDMFGMVSMSAVSPARSKSFKAIDDMLRFGNGDFVEFFHGIVSDLASIFHGVNGFAKELFGWNQHSVSRVAELKAGMEKLLASEADAEHALQAFNQIMETRNARPWAPIPAINFDQALNLWQTWADTARDPEGLKIIKNVANLVVPQNKSFMVPEMSISTSTTPSREPVREGERMHWYDWFTAMSQMGRQKEKFADMGHLGRNYGTLAREFSATIGSMFRDAETGKSGTDDLINLAKEGTPLELAWRELTLRQNEWADANNGAMLPPEEVSKLPKFAKLTPEEQKMVHRINGQRGAAVVYAAQKHYDSFRNVVGFSISRGLMSHDLGLKYSDAEKVGRAFTGLHLDSDVYNLAPGMAEERWGRREEMEKVVAEYVAQGPTQANAIARMEEAFTLDENGKPENPLKATSLANRLGKYREQLVGAFRQHKDGTFDFDSKPGWSPEVRIGRWIIAWKEVNGEPHLVGFRNKVDFDARLAKLNEQKAKGELEYLKQADKTDTEDRFAGMDPDRYGTLTEAVDALNKRVIARMGQDHPEMSEELQRQLMDELKPHRALAAMLESPHMKERRLVAGREELNMAEGLLHYFNNTAYTIAKRYEIAQQNLYLADPVMRDNPQLRQVARKYFNEITDPSEKGYKFLKQLIAFNYIFFSPSLAFVELTQQATNHIPALLMQGLGFGDALNMTRKANVDSVQAFLRGKGLITSSDGTKSKVDYNVYESPEETKVIQEARKKNIIGAGVGWQQEFWELAHDLNFINTKNVFSGSGTLLNRTGLIGKPLYQMYKVGANLHGIAIALNTEVAFLSAYRHFRKTLPQEAAFRQAEELTVESMHGGGRASRPLWFLGIGPMSPGATVGSVMYSLQMYVYNTVAQMGRYLSTAIKNTAKNPTEVTAAHKAAATMLGVQLTLAGVGGIPITSQMIALIEQLFPNTEPRRRMREAFFGAGKWLNSKTHLVGNDEDMGQFLQTAATDGLMTTVAPWNISNRFELGMLMGVDPYRGFDWKNVVGPGGPLLEQLLMKPLQAVSSGDYSQAFAAAIPNSNIRRLVQQAGNGWDLRNQDSRLNLQLDENERWLMRLGLTPKRVAEFRQLDQMQKRAEAVHALDQKTFHEGLADRLVAGDQAGVRESLLQRAREMPGYDPREGARRVAELVQQQTIPYDPLRTGSKTAKTYTISQLFSAYRGERPLGVSETDRYQQKLALTQQLGFPEAPSRQSSVEARLVDQLMTLNPTMTRMEALEQLQQRLHPKATAKSTMYNQVPVQP